MNSFLPASSLALKIALMTLISTLGLSDAFSAPALTPLEALQSRPKTDQIHGFRTDGCTWAPNSDWYFKRETSWGHCCTEHDVAHWAGGTDEQRMTADRRLLSCMQKVGGPAKTFFRAVRMFGHPAAVLGGNLDTRNNPWGYGWPHYQGLEPLNELQQESVCQALADWKQTQFFLDFEATYIRLQGEAPVMPSCEGDS